MIYQLHHPHLVSQSLVTVSPTDPFREVRWAGLERIPLQSQQTESFYLLKTRNRFDRVLRYWKMTDIFKGLDTSLETALWCVPGIQRDTVYWALKRAKNVLLRNGSEDPSSSHGQKSIPRVLLERIQQLQSTLGSPLWSWNSLYALEHQIRYELTLNFRETRKVKKYSGYIRTPSAAGAKRRTSLGGIEFLDEGEPRVLIEEEDLLAFFISPTEDYSLLGVIPEANSILLHWTSPEKEREYIATKIKLGLGYQGQGPIFVLPTVHDEPQFRQPV